MSDLAEATKVVLANSFKFYLKTHYYHWNVEGPLFPQLHKLFGKIYEEVFEAVDMIAEEIRAMNEYAPGSFSRFQQLSSIEDEIELIGWEEMVGRLLADNDRVLASIKHCYDLAEAEGNHGLSNRMAERQDAHAKHAWMLRSLLK
jgi:starvation-inducible DNA-binding protein